MPTGKVKWWSDKKGYGFIAPDDGSTDVFVHHSVIAGEGFQELLEGEQIVYEYEEGPKGPAASLVVRGEGSPLTQIRQDFPGNYTREAQEAVVWAKEEARRLRHSHAGTTHLLLGLIATEDGVAGQTLRRLGITAERVQEALVAVDKVGDGSQSSEIPLTTNAQAALDLALREAESMGNTKVGTEHILIGVTGVDRGLVVPALKSLGSSLAEVREVLFQLLELEPEGIETVPTHQDRPATVDRLGRQRLAEVIAERIRRAHNENTEMAVKTFFQRRQKLRRDRRAAKGTNGFLVHVHAPWGAGKSSLLNFLAHDLRNRDRRGPTHANLSQWIVADFSAWKHQRLIPPWWWLLATVRRCCAQELWQINRGRWLWFWIRDIAWRLWNARAVALTLFLISAVAFIAWRLNWFGLGEKSLTTVQTVVLTAISGIALATTFVGLLRGTSRWLAVGSAEGAARFLKRAHDPLEVYRRRFHNLVRASGYPLAVFIDDLDRCKADYIVELLEGIQTLLMHEPVTYVVAADRAWLCQSFASAYGDFENTAEDLGRPLGFQFLEKTFQISLQIPPMSDQARDAFWSELMRGSPSPSTDEKVEEDSAIAVTFSDAHTQAQVENSVTELIGTRNREQVLAAAVRRMNTPGIEGQLESLLSQFSSLVESNPRSMKRVMNAYGVERDRLLRDGYLLTPTERQQLALLTIAHLRWPELADHLQRHPEDVAYCFGRSKATAKDHKFAQLFEDPQLHRVFNGDGVEATLDASIFRHFPARAPARPS